MRVGIICFENPFAKPSSGGRKCIMSRIKSLILLDDIELDIYLINAEQDKDIQLEDVFILSNKIKNVFQYRTKNSLLHFFSKYPICNNRRFNKNCISELKKREYDFFIYEGEQIAIYRMRKIVRSKYHIIYMHDIESKYRSELSKSQPNFLLKILQKMESKKFKFIEKNINDYFDKVWFISKTEYNEFLEVLSEGKAVYLPLPSIDVEQVSSDKKNSSILYVGDLSLQNNFMSIYWFVNNVFESIKNKVPNAFLTVVGRINKDDKKKLDREGVAVCGYVDDLDAIYAESCCVICPVLYGAGVKVKVIDALYRRSIVVTTTKGIEGTELINGKHLFVEDNSEKMSELICEILTNYQKYRYVADEGFKFVKENHSISNQAHIIQESFKSLYELKRY